MSGPNDAASGQRASLGVKLLRLIPEMDHEERSPRPSRKALLGQLLNMGGGSDHFCDHA